jgi:Leucine-rich repeat (LRR) protein
MFESERTNIIPNYSIIIEKWNLNLRFSDLEQFPLECLVCLEMPQLTLSTFNLDLVRSMANLRKLKIYSNSKINIIKNNTFASLESLEELDLSENNIEAIEDGAFNGLNKLLILDISSNQIEKINYEALSVLTSLESLFLYENKISCLEATGYLNTSNRIFERLKSLKSLYLTRNKKETLFIRPKV